MGELMIPDSFKNAPMADAFAAELNAHDDSLAEGIGQSYGVIGYKGKVWSLRLHGQRHTIMRPDDGTPSSYLDVIILDQNKHKSKSYYRDFVEGNDGARPICASLDGVVPDVDVLERQSQTCALCPRNVLKTNPQTGRKNRECSDYKRLAVLILPTQTKPILGEPLMEPVFLRVPPASLNSLAVMGDTMASQGHHHSSYITRISFDQNKAYPEMVFRPLQKLTNAEAPVILGLRKEPSVARILGTEAHTVGVAAVTNALAAPGTHPTGLSMSDPPASPAPTSISLLDAMGDAQPATPSPIVSPISSAPGLSEPLMTSHLNGGVPSVTPADTGVTESDTDLDAQIAALIKNK